MPFATHILVPTDFSDASALATQAAAVLAERLDCKVTLVHVHDPDGLRAPAQMSWSPERLGTVEAEVKKIAHADLEKVAADHFGEVGEVSVELLDDESPSRAICRRAEEIGADLIVISTHGRAGLKHLLIGSVAERVVRHSPVPVLTLRSKSTD